MSMWRNKWVCDATYESGCTCFECNVAKCQVHRSRSGVTRSPRRSGHWARCSLVDRTDRLLRWVDLRDGFRRDRCAQRERSDAVRVSQRCTEFTQALRPDALPSSPTPLQLQLRPRVHHPLLPALSTDRSGGPELEDAAWCRSDR